jgi:predicted transcriptional regulator
MAEPEDLPPLSEAQLEIMDVVWDRGEATLGDVWSLLSSRRPVARNTVQTLITRLVEKGWLRYRAEGKVFHYSATRPRAATLRGLVRRLVDTAFRGSSEGLVMALLDDKPLEEGEAARIRALIEQAEKQAGEGEGR